MNDVFDVLHFEVYYYGNAVCEHGNVYDSLLKLSMFVLLKSRSLQCPLTTKL
jgi:hypothetical protein